MSPDVGRAAGAGGPAAAAGIRFNISPEKDTESQPDRKRFVRGARSATPTMCGSENPTRRRSATPKRPRSKIFMQSPPSRVDPGSPWSNVASEVPGAGASVDDVRFWTYQKFGTIHHLTTDLATTSNYLMDNMKHAKEEMEERPTYDQVKTYVGECLQDYFKKAEVGEVIKTKLEEHPTFQATEKFMKEEFESYHSKILKEQFQTRDQSLSMITAQVETAMLKIGEALESTKQNVQWIETVESNFHIHVGESFAKLEGVVEDLRVQQGRGRGQDHQHLQPPPGVPQQCKVDPDGCQVQNVHCPHVVQLMLDVQELRLGYNTLANLINGGTAQNSPANGAAHNLLRAQVNELEKRMGQHESRQRLIQNGLYNDPAATGHQGFPQGTPGGVAHSQFGAPHGPSGGGHGGSGGPGGRPQGDPAGGHRPDHAHGAPDQGERVDYNKLFDDKVAMSQDFSYAGGDGGDRWRMKVRGYLVSKCPALLGILKWVEECDQNEITEAMWTARALNGGFMTELSVTRLSGAIWGFLNTCLKSEAHTIFESADMLNGLEGWRLVIQDIQRGRAIRMQTLRKLVKHPPVITKLEDVAAGMLRYQNLLKEYEAVNGILPSAQEQRSDLLDTLPQELRENLMWRATNKPDESLSDFKNHIRATVNEILFHRGKLPSPINAISQGPTELQMQPGSTASSVAGSGSSSLEDAVCAMMKKMGFRPSNGPPRTGPPGARQGERGDRPPRCANCGEMGHLKDDCTKAKVPLSERKCHNCGKPGHIASQCRNNPGGRAGMVEEEEDRLGCVAFRTVGKTDARGRPTPKPATLSDFIPIAVKNKFEGLKTDSDEPEVTASSSTHSTTPTISTSSSSPTPGITCRLATRAARDARRIGYWEKASKQMVALDKNINEPNDVVKEPNDDLGDRLGVVYYEDSDDEDAIMAAEEEIEVGVAMDSGCVANVMGPKDKPSTVEARHPPNKRRRNFVAANGSDMENYGEAEVDMVQEDGKVLASTFTVTDTTRPLHSTSQVCDSESPACPTGHEVLFTKGVATVVPDGALSRFLGSVRQIAHYPRRGGLYVAKMRVRARGRRAPTQPDPKKPKAQGFGRQGARR